MEALRRRALRLLRLCLQRIRALGAAWMAGATDVIPKQLEVEILRLFHVERWRVGAIARELGVHHSAVSRVLDRAGARPAPPRRSSVLDPFLAFIVEMLERYPKITASRLFGMVKERGYPGGADHFRHAIGKIRPRPRQEPFLRLRTLPGEQAQVDWADFGKVRIGAAERRLMAFVMVLSYSRRLFLHFFLGQTTTCFLRGHVMALEAFGGCPRIVLYDNLKSAVLERRGDAIRFNPDLLAFCAHYRLEPRPVAPYRGNEKGRVERAIRYVRSAFFEGLEWRTIEELNERARAFSDGPAMERRWPEDSRCTVAEAFAAEAPSLLGLPGDSFPTLERADVATLKRPYVRFDLNDYSVPYKHMGKPLSLVASLETVRILDGSEVVAEHRRSYDRGAVVEDRRHIHEILAMKRNARRGIGLDRLSRTAPESMELLRAMAERGANIGSSVFALLQLLDTYGSEELRFGLREALVHEAFHPHAVRHAIERRRGERGERPALPISLPDDPRIRNLVITPHDLADYDPEIDHAAESQEQNETDRFEGGA